jgi:hypothetical protein
MDAQSGKVRAFPVGEHHLVVVALDAPFIRSSNDKGYEEISSVCVGSVDQENIKGRTYSVAQAWRTDRIPQFPHGANTKSVALFTEATVGVDSRGEVVKLELLGYTLEKGNTRTPFLVKEHLL